VTGDRAPPDGRVAGAGAFGGRSPAAADNRHRKERNLATESKRRSAPAPEPAFGVKLDDLMGYNLRRAHGVQKARFAAVFGPHGVRPVTLSVLGVIYENGGIKQSDLGRQLNIKRANIVPLMSELEGRGLIARRACDDDRRAHVVTLTPAGRKFTVKMLDLHKRLEDDLGRTLGLRERDELVALLKKFRRLAPDPDLSELD
jgi:DNA-binding MarR family transcriptional regulator